MRLKWSWIDYGFQRWLSSVICFTVTVRTQLWRSQPSASDRGDHVGRPAVAYEGPIRFQL